MEDKIKVLFEQLELNKPQQELLEEKDVDLLEVNHIFMHLLLDNHDLFPESYIDNVVGLFVGHDIEGRLLILDAVTTVVARARITNIERLDELLGKYIPSHNTQIEDEEEIK